MAEYTKLKSKKFGLQKDAMAWAKKMKKQNQGGSTIKIETNYLPNQPKSTQWEGVVLRKNG